VVLGDIKGLLALLGRWVLRVLLDPRGILDPEGNQVLLGLQGVMAEMVETENQAKAGFPGIRRSLRRSTLGVQENLSSLLKDGSISAILAITGHFMSISKARMEKMVRKSNLLLKTITFDGGGKVKPGKI